MPLCSIIGCSNAYRHTYKPTLFYFVPKDSRAQAWITALKGQVLEKSVLLASICIRHFEEDAFDEPPSFKLTKNAIPTIFPGWDPTELEEPPPKKNKCVDSGESSGNVLLNIKCEKDDDSELKYWGEEWLDKPSTTSNQNVTDKDDELESLRIEIAKMEKLKSTLTEQNQKLTEQDRKLHEELVALRSHQGDNPNEFNGLSQDELDLLQKCFSPAQINVLMGTKKKVRWTSYEMAVSYTLSGLISREFYDRLRTELKFPLPSWNSVERFAKNSKNSVESYEKVE